MLNYSNDLFNIRPCAVVNIPDKNDMSEIQIIGLNDLATRYLLIFKISGRIHYGIYAYHKLLEAFDFSQLEFKQMMFLRLVNINNILRGYKS